VRISIDALLALDAIERKGSFASAAHELHRVPSALTYTVQKLEQDLDVLLFDRRGHRARLTAAGRELLNEGRHILRAAGELEAHVKRVATGWEAELRIAYDDVIPAHAVLEIAAAFHHQECGTRLRITAEVFGGTWDALSSNRADLAIGVSGDGPVGGGYSTRLLGVVEWVFAVTPGHPLANAKEPLTPDDILAHRAAVVADSSRHLSPRTAGLLTGQDTLTTVHNVAAKLLAHKMGLGVGHLPRGMAEREAAAGHLVIKHTLEGRPTTALYLAWRSTRGRKPGKALAWWIAQLQSKDWLEQAMLQE
jgi:DNA-binding transcriptional LysR family regulator